MKNIFYNLGFCLILFLQPYFLKAQNETEPNNTLQTANAITLSTTVEGSINPSGDLDFYKFTIPRSGIITTQFANVPADMRIQMVLFDANQTVVPHSEIWGVAGQNYTWETKVCQGGLYYLRVLARDGNINSQLYSVTVRIDTTDGYECNETLQAATSIALNTPLSASIRTSGDLDFYKFTIPRSGIITTQFANVPADMRIQMVLFDANQTVVPHSEIWGVAGQNYTWETKVCQGGLYYLRVLARDGNTSSQLYSVTVRIDTTDVYECNETLQTATPMTLNTSLVASIRTSGDLDFYKFTVPQAGIISYQITNVAPNIAMNMRLYDHAQTEVPNSVVTGNDGQNYTYETKVCQGGQYYIRLSDRDRYYSNAQLYTLTLRFDSTDVYECNDNFSTAKQITINTPISAAIRTQNDNDYYKFTVPRAGIISYRITNVAPNIAMNMRLYDNAQTEVTNSVVTGHDGQNYTYETKVCQGGQYYIRLRDADRYVSGYYANAQLYTLTLSLDTTDVYECNQDFATATPIHKNICATIRSAGDIDFYKINIPASGNYAFSVQAPNCIALSMTLYNSNNQAVKTASNANRGGFVSFTQNITTQGSYYLAIHSYYGGESCASLYCLSLSGAITSTTDYKADATISIVPNPVTDRLTVNYAEGTIQNLQITNVTGQRILQKIVNDAQTEIDVSSLSNGLYLLIMQTDQGQQITKFIKN